MAGQIGHVNRVTLRLQKWNDLVPAPGAVPAAVQENDIHRRNPSNAFLWMERISTSVTKETRHRWPQSDTPFFCANAKGFERRAPGYDALRRLF